MNFKAKLNTKFYIVSVILLGMVALGIYGLYFLNANEILMDDAPMDATTKTILSALIGVIVLSWALSLLALIRQMVLGYAFCIDDKGIHRTLTAVNVLAFIFIVPIKCIPYEAIERASIEGGILTLHIDKKKVDVLSILRPFVRKEYHLFAGFTSEMQEDIKNELSKYFNVSLNFLIINLL